MCSQSGLAFKQRTSKGICPVRFCRRCVGNKKTLCERHAKQVWRSANPEKSAYANLRDSARHRRIKFTLTFVDFMSVIAPTAYLTEKGNYAHCLHIDREDNTKGYEVGNLRVITCSENVKKENERRKAYVPYFQQQSEEAREPDYFDDENPF